jgi:hypothetical protein
MAVEDTARINGDIVRMVYHSLRNGIGGIHTAKTGLKSLMQPTEKNGQLVYPWQYFRMVDTSGVTIMDVTQNPPATFREFIEAPPLRGLGEKLEDIERLIADDAESLVRLRELVVAGRGNPTGNNQYGNGDNVTISTDLFDKPEPSKPQAERGNSRAYALTRLKKERPDLFDRVAAKELTANRAAIEAGWRKVPSALETLQRAWKKASSEEQRQFLEWISNT